MKKIGAILFIGLFIVGGYTGYRYYADTYKGEKAYAQVPLEIPERKQTVDDNQKSIDGQYSLHYRLTDRQKSSTFGTKCLHRSNH